MVLLAMLVGRIEPRQAHGGAGVEDPRVTRLEGWLDQGIAQPIDGLPGVDQYVRDFTPFTRAIAQRDGKTWGLPYFSTVLARVVNCQGNTSALAARSTSRPAV